MPGDRIFTLGYENQVFFSRTLDLSTGQVLNLTLDLPPEQYSVWFALGVVGNSVVLGTLGLSNLNDETIVLAPLDGSAAKYVGQYSSNSYVFAVASSTAPASNEIVIAYRPHPGECVGTFPTFVYTVGPADAISQIQTSFGGATPPGHTFGIDSGYTMRDLWTDAARHLHATIATWSCDNSKPDEQSKKVLARHSQTWNLTGHTWIPTGATTTSERAIGGDSSVELNIPDCIGAVSSANPTLYCSTGSLVRISRGTATQISKDVIAITSP
jgi:hypothetical protein